MLKALNDNDEITNLRTSNTGALKVELQNDSSGQEPEEPKIETTLNANVQTIGTDSITIAINKKVSEIDIANFSENANITIVIGTLNAVIGPCITTTLKINKDVTNISLSSTEADTKVQVIVKGEE